MSDLFDKLNVLVKSNLRQVLTLERRKGSGLDRTSRGRKGTTPDLERDIAALRQRINQALDDEDQLQRDIQALRDETTEWDRKADAALSNGDEANARYAVQQMQLKQQQAALLEADLEQHRFSAAELIRQVNELEAVVAEAAVAAAQAQKVSSDSGVAASAAAPSSDPGVSSAARNDDSGKQSGSAPHQNNNDDLDQRRARLSQ